MVDLLVLAHVTLALWRGRKRGFTVEFPSAASLVVFFLTGCGLFSWIHRGLARASEAIGHYLGVFTFFGLLVAAFVLWRRSHEYVVQLAGRWVPQSRQRLAGGIAGGVRAFVLDATLLLILAHWPLHAMTRWIVEGSFVGRLLIHFVLPVYSHTHGAL